MRYVAGPTLIVVLAITPAGAQERPLEQVARWAWFRSVSTVDSWWITHGKADVDTSGERFAATLWDAQDTSFARLSIDGTISGDTVDVVITVNNSDVPPIRAHGIIRRICWTRGGREVLMLNTDFEIVGLVRELDVRDSRCRGA